MNRAQKRGSQKERLSLEAKIEAETAEQEDETVSETVEQKLKPWYGVDETKHETIEQKLKQVGKGKKLNLKRKGISCNCEKHSGLTKGVSWKGFGCGLKFKIEIGFQVIEGKGIV